MQTNKRDRFPDLDERARRMHDLVAAPALPLGDVALFLDLPVSTLDLLRAKGDGPRTFKIGRRLGDLGDVIFADLSAYAIGMRREVTIERSTDAYFTTDEIGFKLRVRLDGQPKAATATKLRDGTNTVSDFVTLEAR